MTKMKYMTNQISLFDIANDDKEKWVRRISYEDCKPFLLNVHYARRMPNIVYAFGLFLGGGVGMVGCVTYGIPASEHLCKGLAGEENKGSVYELNRLVILDGYSGHNYASYLVAQSLKMLPNKTFVVSYADTAWSHVGYIYQATNFLYTGMSAKRVDWYMPNGKHPRSHIGADKELFQERSPKHRYVYLVGDKRTKKQMRKELKYPVIDKYPKGDEQRYNTKNPKPFRKKKIITRDGQFVKEEENW